MAREACSPVSVAKAATIHATDGYDGTASAAAPVGVARNPPGLLLLALVIVLLLGPSNVLELLMRLLPLLLPLTNLLCIEVSAPAAAAPVS